MAWVYILRCADQSLYVGSTRDLEARVAQHARGLGGEYTSRRLPVTLVWAQEYDRIDEAWAMERRLHGWSRAKREALIAGEIELLRGYSVRNRKERRSAVDD
ncbi:GIY-YIG nuclease family protein [Enemella evansiae]|uniref:GIY-YIG nuclease family protein n=1 Tax=Enemella evansiae TaxID=2016499 RepID=UPI001060F576|nr:GIY-YIG nuclease family protein [Enemella evansiae]TDO91866.1 putative endonuclease [Enemella evansiae]